MNDDFQKQLESIKAEKQKRLSYFKILTEHKKTSLENLHTLAAHEEKERKFYKRFTFVIFAIPLIPFALAFILFSFLVSLVQITGNVSVDGKLRYITSSRLSSKSIPGITYDESFGRHVFTVDFSKTQTATFYDSDTKVLFLEKTATTPAEIALTLYTPTGEIQETSLFPKEPFSRGFHTGRNWMFPSIRAEGLDESFSSELYMVSLYLVQKIPPMHTTQPPNDITYESEKISVVFERYPRLASTRGLNMPIVFLYQWKVTGANDQTEELSVKETIFQRKAAYMNPPRQ